MNRFLQKSLKPVLHGTKKSICHSGVVLWLELLPTTRLLALAAKTPTEAPWLSPCLQLLYTLPNLGSLVSKPNLPKPWLGPITIWNDNSKHTGTWSARIATQALGLQSTTWRQACMATGTVGEQFFTFALTSKKWITAKNQAPAGHS